jgi:diaminopimelate decarboxylase
MPWDRLFAGAKLPELEIGDMICIEGAGAYFVPMETEFSFARPKLIVINQVT